LRGLLIALLASAVGCGSPVPSGSATADAITNTPGTSPTTAATPPTPPPSPTFISSDGPGASQSYDPVYGQVACTLVDVETVEAVVGIAALTSFGVSQDADSGACMYRASDQIVARVTYSASRVAARFDAHAGMSEPVDDIGDAAIWVDIPGFLYVRVGSRAVGIQLTQTVVSPDELQAKSITLGRAAIAGL